MAEQPSAPDDPESASDDARRERERQFTRRRILEVGWTVPVIALTSQVGGQGPTLLGLPPSHEDGGHGDYNYHTDTLHTDGGGHHDMLHPHGDSDEGILHQDVTNRGHHWDGGHHDLDSSNPHTDSPIQHGDHVLDHSDVHGHTDSTGHGDSLHQDETVHWDGADIHSDLPPP